MPGPQYIAIPDSACRLTTAYRCPECHGTIKLDVEKVRPMTDILCPYCLNGIAIPGKKRERPEHRVKTLSRSGVFINA